MDDNLAKLEDQSDTPSEVASTWNSSHENLLAAIADRSNCSRWLHSHCQLVYDRYNFYLTIPSIVITTLSGSATIGLTNIFSDSSQRSASIVIGLCTLGCGALTSINQFMKTAQYAEAHRSASVAYGKLHRIISNELILRRDQRVNALDFLKIVRTEQDRLQESSPTILEVVIHNFRREFVSHVDLQKPEIVGDLDHVRINRAYRHEETPTAPRALNSPCKSFEVHKPKPRQSSEAECQTEETEEAP
jgi:hypothetical protein